MAKPYDFESPLATENTIRKVADIIKTNFTTKEEYNALAEKIDESLRIMEADVG